MPRRALTREQVLGLLAATPPRTAALTAGPGSAPLQASSPDGGWSATEVLAHLRAYADVWGGCIETMLAHDRPTVRAVSPRTWIRRTDYRDQDFGSSLQSVATQRSALLAVLEPLAPDGWARAATVTGAGTPLERTVLFYARWLAGHERPHLTQLERIATRIRLEQGAPTSA